ncbi:unnamed protein product [Calypogeia fissa]
MKITSYKSTLIKPEIPTPPKILSCAACDNFVRPIHVRTVYFFGEQSPGANKDAIKVLKNALSKLLVTFYPNAGRVRSIGDGTPHLEIDCNDAGVVFIEASVDITIDDLGGFQPNPLFDKLSPSADYSMPIEEQPVQFLQATKFACGGFSLGMALQHVVADGISAHNFIVSWTEVVLGKPISVKPVFDHTLLNAAGAPVPASPPSEMKIRPKGVPPVKAATRPVKERVFTFTPDQLKKIKEDANSLAPERNERTFSTFEALSAHTWKGIIRAKALDANEEVKFFTTLDARKRLTPNLPDGYYGNAIIFTSNSTTAGEILSKPLSFSASLVRAAVARMTNENMRSMIAWADAQSESIQVAIDTAANDVSSAGWFRMPFYETDFGYGKALFAGPADNPFNGCVLMLPGHIGPGSINIFINLYTEHMEKLETDADFLTHKVIVS